ncbi:MAG: SUMF1/EgtB/PvdO family nonheme iron enzyme, partial [Fervidobacterium sp.]
CSVFSTYVFSQVVQYKTGEVITGTIVESTDKYLVVDSTIGKIFIPLDQVRSVVFGDTENFPTSGSEISINGRKYAGYFKDLKSGVMTVSTWFGKIVVHSFQTLDYVGFEQKDFPANQNVGMFRMELSSSENYVCVLYTGDVFIGKNIYSSDSFLVIVDQYDNEFYVSKMLIEDIYIPYKYASGYDLVVSKDGKNVYGKVSIDNSGMMQISGSWGSTTVEASNVVFTTFDSTKAKGLDSFLSQLEYDKAAVAVLAASTPLTVDGKEVSTIKVYPKEIIDSRTGITFVFVPGGTFSMGASKDWKGVDEDELPMRQVYVSGFYISKYPITTKQYLDFLRAAQVSNVALGNHIDTVEVEFLKTKLIVGYTADEKFYNIPITGINWNSAKEYCNWAGYQLPTEAQWEKAARGKDGRMYPWGNEMLSTGFNDGKKEYTIYDFERVDLSPYGVVNMYGLPIEFCRDYYDKSAYKKLPAENPFNASGTLVVGRSGAVAGRITDRISVDPKEKRNDFTFR